MAELKFTFNSGRLYAKEGQIIRVETHDFRVYFYDESRGIAGSFDQGGLQGEREIKEALMFVYDRGMIKYEPIPLHGDHARRLV